MNRLTYGACALAVALMMTGCGFTAPWGVGMEDTITQDEAADRATEHINNAISALPDTAELEKRQGMGRASCDDPTDGGPKNRVIVGEALWIRGLPVEDNEHNVELLHQYWTSNRYRVLHDLRPDKLSLSVEHEEDAFRMSIRTSNKGSLAITVSSPCVWPEGTPNP